eukprot:6664489-Pyramimonas_sp.AAC.2
MLQTGVLSAPLPLLAQEHPPAAALRLRDGGDVDDARLGAGADIVQQQRGEEKRGHNIHRPSELVAVFREKLLGLVHPGIVNEAVYLAVLGPDLAG